MKIRTAAAVGLLAICSLAATRQTPPQTAVVLNRMLSSYRSLQSFKETVTIKRKIGEKEMRSAMWENGRQVGWLLAFWGTLFDADKKIRRFDVAVNDATIVCILKSGRDL